MKDAGIQDPDIVKSLGMFALVIFVLILVVAFWAITRCLQKRGINVGQKIKVALEKKLFYNSLYRYMIISNLKLTFTLWGFLLAAYSFETTQESLKTIGYLAGIGLLLVWPLFIFVFLQKNQDRLDEPKFVEKHATIYQGIKVESKSALLYNVVFCVRRFYLVLINMYFSPQFPLSNFESHANYFKVAIFLVMQTMYMIYIIEAKPHTEDIFIKLEYFNEGLLVMLCYMMFVYTGIVCRGLEDGSCDTKVIFTDKLPLYISCTLTGVIVLGNFIVLIRNSFYKFRIMLRKKKEQKRQKAIM